MEDELAVAKLFDARTLGRLRDDAAIASIFVRAYKEALLKEYSDPSMARSDTILKARSDAANTRPDATPANLSASCVRLVKLLHASLQPGDADERWRIFGAAAVQSMVLRTGEVRTFAGTLEGLSELFLQSDDRKQLVSVVDNFHPAHSYGGVEQNCMFLPFMVDFSSLTTWLQRCEVEAHQRGTKGPCEFLQVGDAAQQPPALRPFGHGPSLGFRPSSTLWTALVERVQFERAMRDHEVALQSVRSHLSVRGIECLESPLIDLVFLRPGSAHIVEVKSLTSENEREQVRAAFAQLHDYRFVYRNVPPFTDHVVTMWVALAAPPADPWVQAFLRNAEVRLIWINRYGAVEGPDVDLLGA